MAASQGRFILGTGRCGSTLLSRMLSEHEGVLSLFEWFPGMDMDFRFKSEPVAGAEFAAHLERDHPVLTAVLSRGANVPEVVYPFGAEGMRHGSPGEPIPWALAIPIARMTEQPDRLFRQLLRATRSLPVQPMLAQHRALFDWLCEEQGKRIWIERSAGSIEFADTLHSGFPEGRFVHLHRDGREAALSMREYPALRVAVAIMNGLAGDIDFSYEGLSQLMRDDPGAIDSLLATRPPIELYGQYWNQQILNGTAALDAIDRSNRLDVRFEDMVREPWQTLARIRDFLQLDGGDEWVSRGAELVRGLPRLRYQDLPRGDQLKLSEACAPAMAALGREL